MFHVKPRGEKRVLNLLREQALRWGLDLSSEQLGLLEAYADLLSAYTQANVIGTRDFDRIILEHIVDALSCSLVPQLTAGKHTIDIGSGGGLPGLPLHIALPDPETVLLEATTKKAQFLQLVVEHLGLRGVTVINERVEALGKDPRYRDHFDVAAARALAALPVVLEYCAPLVRRDGVIIAMKGNPTSQELEAGTRAASELGLELTEVHHVAFDPRMVQKKRQLLVFSKRAATPDRYPRRVGLAKQQPLGTGGRG